SSPISISCVVGLAVTGDANSNAITPRAAATLRLICTQSLHRQDLRGGHRRMDAEHQTDTACNTGPPDQNHRIKGETDRQECTAQSCQDDTGYRAQESTANR